MVLELIASLGLPVHARALDLGCGEGSDSVALASRFALDVLGIDPVARHVELAEHAAREADLATLARFAVGVAEDLPADDGSVDLVWCKDVLVHVADLDRAYGEIARVLAPGGHAVVYQMFATDRLASDEADQLWTTMGVVASSARLNTTIDAIAGTDLQLEQDIVLGSEWDEWSYEHSLPTPHALRVAGLQRDPEHYIDQFGRQAYDIMLGDALWHVFALIGKLSGRALVLTRPHSD